MIKNYPMNMDAGTHTVQVTIQLDDYVGHVAVRIGGTRGVSLLDFELIKGGIIDIPKSVVVNDCSLEWHEEDEYFRLTAYNEAGDTTEFDCGYDELNYFVTALEIIDYKPDEENID